MNDKTKSNGGADLYQMHTWTYTFDTEFNKDF